MGAHSEKLDGANAASFVQKQHSASIGCRTSASNIAICSGASAILALLSSRCGFWTPIFYCSKRAVVCPVVFFSAVE